MTSKIFIDKQNINYRDRVRALGTHYEQQTIFFSKSIMTI